MTTESTMAIRQPVVAKDLLITSITPLAAIPPKGTPRLASDIQNARERRSAPNSASNEEVPPNSPPSPIPCTMRKTTKSTGAAIPKLAYPGKSPVKQVVAPTMKCLAGMRISGPSDRRSGQRRMPRQDELEIPHRRPGTKTREPVWDEAWKEHPRK